MLWCFDQGKSHSRTGCAPTTRAGRFRRSSCESALQQATTEVVAAAGLLHFHALQALRQRVRVAALGQLDAQAHLVRAVGVAQRVLVADLAGVVELDQALVEGLHAEQ